VCCNLLGIPWPGVFFRKHTVAEAKKLEVVGWVANTPEDTVQGECQGAAANLEKMCAWALSHTAQSECVRFMRG